MSNEFKRTPTCGENDVDLRVATEPRRVTDAVLSQIIAAKDGEIAALTAEVTHLAEKLAERDAAGMGRPHLSDIEHPMQHAFPDEPQAAPEVKKAMYAAWQVLFDVGVLPGLDGMSLADGIHAALASQPTDATMRS